jgi:hypothetical protein
MWDSNKETAVGAYGEEKRLAINVDGMMGEEGRFM